MDQEKVIKLIHEAIEAYAKDFASAVLIALTPYMYNPENLRWDGEKWTK